MLIKLDRASINSDYRDSVFLFFPLKLIFTQGISRSAKGYCMVSVLETMKTYSAEDGLTEEALVTKLRTCRCHHLFLHASLRHNSSGLYYILHHRHCGKIVPVVC